MRKIKALIKAEKSLAEAEKRIKNLVIWMDLHSCMVQTAMETGKQQNKAFNVLLGITESEKISNLLAELHDLRNKEVKK